MTNIRNVFKIKTLLMGLMFLALVVLAQAQEIDILLKNGHVFDPKNNIDAIMDVAIADGKILEVAPNISSQTAKKVVDATGLYISQIGRASCRERV